MIIKKSLSISFLFLVCHFNNYGHEVKKSVSECTGKVAQQRPQLFTQAEQYEQNLINARAQCLHANDCDINVAYKQARHDVLRSIIMLANRLEELEGGIVGVCNVCEKNEATDIKKRLVELLKSSL
jgi:hypothetical protein